MSVPAWVHNGRTMNTCQLTKSYNRWQNVHTQVPLAGSQGTGRRAPVRMPLRFQRPPTSRFARGEKLAVAPKWPCRCGLPFLHSSSLKIFHPNSSFKSHPKRHLPQEGHPARPYFASFTPHPPGLLPPKECVSSAPVNFQGAHLFTHLSPPVKPNV